MNNARPQLILQPIHNNTVEILKVFATGTPLSCDQQHFVDQHWNQLSSEAFDPVYRYYIDAAKKKEKLRTSFLLSSTEFNAESNKKLKARLSIVLKQKSSHAIINLTQKQFVKFKELNIQELIFWHGNQFLTHAPFFPGGLPPVIFFQWGNTFGIVKYVMLADEKALKANLLIYFEDRMERNLEQCVADYKKTLTNEHQVQKNILLDKKIVSPSFDHFIIKTPILTLTPLRR